MKGFLQHTVDFEILENSNTKSMVFIDCSNYYEQPETPLLEIHFPGSNKFFLLNVEAKRVNTFNSNTIGWSDILEDDCPLDFPDGIYKFVYKICPYDQLYKEKYILICTNINALINKIYNNVDIESILSSNAEMKNEIVDIHILLESAKANVELENISKANKDYNLANSKINRLLNKINSL